MRPDILIAGQGLAGTLLAWAFERSGIPFAVVDRGHGGAATSAAAGIINPVTGRRLVKAWRVDALLPQARSAYHELESELGVSLWREMRVRRLFADEAEREAFARKCASGELAPFAKAGRADEAGFWIEGAARVDLRLLLTAARARWVAQGRLRMGCADVWGEAGRYRLVIDCTGLAGTREPAAGAVPWEYSKGELLELAVAGLDPGVVLNRRHWALPVGPGGGWFGAIHEPGVSDPTPTATGRSLLEASAREMLSQPFTVTGHRAGVRVNVRDRRPVAGVHPANPRIGVVNALGAKGVLFAPFVAAEWVRQVQAEAAFDPAIDVRRFLDV